MLTTQLDALLSPRGELQSAARAIVADLIAAVPPSLEGKTLIQGFFIEDGRLFRARVCEARGPLEEWTQPTLEQARRLQSLLQEERAQMTFIEAWMERVCALLVAYGKPFAEVAPSFAFEKDVRDQLTAALDAVCGPQRALVEYAPRCASKRVL